MRINENIRTNAQQSLYQTSCYKTELVPGGNEEGNSILTLRRRQFFKLLIDELDKLLSWRIS